MIKAKKNVINCFFFLLTNKEKKITNGFTEIINYSIFSVLLSVVFIFAKDGIDAPFFFFARSNK